MYLLKLYKWNKSLFIFFVCFICIQLFINFKQGITATPILHFGMYSGKFNLPKEITVWELHIDGRRLELSDFSAKNVDNFIQPVQMFSSIKENKELYETTIKRLLAGLKIRSNEKYFDPSISTEDFKRWYKNRLRNILKKDITTINVYQNLYSVNGATLNKIQTQLIYEID